LERHPIVIVEEKSKNDKEIPVYFAVKGKDILKAFD